MHAPPSRPLLRKVSRRQGSHRLPRGGVIFSRATLQRALLPRGGVNLDIRRRRIALLHRGSEVSPTSVEHLRWRDRRDRSRASCEQRPHGVSPEVVSNEEAA